jgi:hypothetical protein
VLLQILIFLQIVQVYLIYAAVIMLVQIEIKFSVFLFDLINIQTSRPTQYSLTWFTGLVTATAPNNTVLNSCSSTTLSVSLFLDSTNKVSYLSFSILYSLAIQHYQFGCNL